MADENWERLAELLVARRVQLGYTRRSAFVDAKGLGHARIVASIEKCERTNFSRATIAQLEQAYEWGTGSIRTVLAGGEPIIGDRPSEPEPFRLPAKADRLSGRQRAAVLGVVDAMLDPDSERVTISTRAVLVDDESEEAVGARPDSAGRSRAPRSAPRGRPRGPRPPTPADEGRSR